MSDDHHEQPLLDNRVLHAAADGCEQSKMLISRRALMGISASLFTWAYMPRLAQAATGQDPRLLIVILRGGMDGLNVVVPTFDNYWSARGSAALDTTEIARLDGQYSINKKLANFAAMYASGEAAFVHAIAPPLRIRSHFQCQYNLESGNNSSETRANEKGWLNNLLGVLPKGSPVKTAGLLSVGSAPLIMAGPQQVMAWAPGPAPRSDTFNAVLQDMYDHTDPDLASLLRRGLQTDDFANPANSTAGNVSTLQKAFIGAANLLASPSGPRIAALSIEGWDTHANQDLVLNTRLTELNDSLQKFKTTIGAAWSNTVVVCVTEFGRTVAPNGTDGTDHGTGTVALLAGGALAGGKAFGEWPGLSKLLDGRDLQAPNDLRSLFKGVAADHLGVSKTALDTIVFEDSADTPAMRGLIRTGAGAGAV